MKIVDKIKQVVREHDSEGAVQIASQCRFRLGMNYRETYEFVREHCDGELDLPAWDNLLREGE